MTVLESQANVQPADSGEFLSPKDLADAIGVSESSLKRWVDDGRLVAVRTAGGHRRIPLHEAVRFVRAQRLQLARPELLGVPTMPTEISSSTNEPFLQLLLAENAIAARAWLVQRYLGGVGFAALSDGPIRGAMTHVGELWKHSERGIMVEHRATDIAIQALSYLRSLLPPVADDAWTALGFTPSGDPYLMPAMMSAAVLAEAGWHDRNLGPDTPLSAVLEAVETYRPKLVMCALSLEEPGEIARHELVELANKLGERGIYLVLGGRGAPAIDLIGREHVLVVASMVELSAFARGLSASRTVAVPNTAKS